MDVPVFLFVHTFCNYLNYCNYFYLFILWPLTGLTFRASRKVGCKSISREKDVCWQVFLLRHYLLWAREFFIPLANKEAESQSKPPFFVDFALFWFFSFVWVFWGHIWLIVGMDKFKCYCGPNQLSYYDGLPSILLNLGWFLAYLDPIQLHLWLGQS